MIMTGAGSDGVQEGVTMHSKESCSGPTHVQRTPGADPTQSRHRVGVRRFCVGRVPDVCQVCVGRVLFVPAFHLRMSLPSDQHSTFETPPPPLP
jgi:hypothetical protein